MIGALDALTRAVLLRLDPELAHRLAVKGLALLPALAIAPDDPRLAVEAFGLSFANPVGLAAGFDKNGEVAEQILRLGFGFTEVGTVTPVPQQGNPCPRVFRLLHDRAIINRYGFNSEGHARVAARLKLFRDRHAGDRTFLGRVAVNIGANKDSTDRVNDYVAGIKIFAALADFFVVNISSPNTPGLRDLQQDQALDDLLARTLAARDEAVASGSRKPVLVKLAPDLSEAELDRIIRICRDRAIDGLIVTNTTLARPDSLQDLAIAQEAGGLSGRPLFEPATRFLAQAFLRVERQFPLVGAGGIDSTATAIAKIEAGATLIELYSGLVYEGLALVGAIKNGLVAHLAQSGFQSLSEVTGMASVDWAAGKAAVSNLR